MDKKQMPRVSGGKIVFGMILAVIFGILTPFILTMEVALLTPVVLVGAILLVFLRCYAGAIPATMFTIIQVIASYYLLGPTIMWMIVLASVIPACVVILGIERKRHFFDQMRDGLAVHILGMLLAVFMAYTTFGGDMIAKLIEAIRTQFNAMPDEWFAPFVDAMNSAIYMIGEDAAAGYEAMTVESYREIVSGTMLNYMQETYVTNMPGALITGSVISAVVSVFWGNWIMARKGWTTPESFMGLHKWYVPTGMTAMLMVLTLVSNIMTELGNAVGDSVFMVAYMLLTLAFTLQALASFDRRLVKGYASLTKRRVIIILLLIGSLIIPGVGTVLFVYGCASAMFGSHGIFRRRVQVQVEVERKEDQSEDENSGLFKFEFKRKDDHDDDDPDDDDNNL